MSRMGLQLQCEDCDKWRLLFCKHKLNVQEVCDLQKILDDVMWLEELDLPGRLTNVFVKEHTCSGNIEKLYYSCGFEALCVHCGSEDVDSLSSDSDFFPQCQECEDLAKVARPKKKQ